MKNMNYKELVKAFDHCEPIIQWRWILDNKEKFVIINKDDELIAYVSEEYYAQDINDKAKFRFKSSVDKMYINDLMSAIGLKYEKDC